MNMQQTFSLRVRQDTKKDSTRRKLKGCDFSILWYTVKSKNAAHQFLAAFLLNIHLIQPGDIGLILAFQYLQKCCFWQLADVDIYFIYIKYFLIVKLLMPSNYKRWVNNTLFRKHIESKYAYFLEKILYIIKKLLKMNGKHIS